MPKVTGMYKAEVRDKILQAAIQSFSQTGFDRTKMEDIAKRLGLSKGTIYLYFASKEDLFLGICDYYLKLMKERQDSTVFSRREDLLLDAERFYDEFQELEQGNDKIMLEMVVESSRNSKLRRGMYEHRLKVYDAVVDHLNKHIEKGIIRKDVDASGLASAFVALYDGLTASKMLGIGEANNKKAWVAMVRAVIDSITKT
ncbi:MAG TPA: TetR/AcrR family transcriptional regulator [Nitrososphaera sp.]|jgi:AcrR family transcriptional regulator|nr:TetR/AcrR family transcriptional regulator [Nitrososphaera sp.]